MIVTIQAEHFDLGAGMLTFCGVSEVTDGAFNTRDPAVYALLPAGMPETYESAFFVGAGGHTVIASELFEYRYERTAVWIAFCDSDDAEQIFRITSFGKAAA